MTCNPCCCFNVKDSAVMIGIWTLVYSIASLFLFGWQTGVLNHCRSVTMSQANLQCEWDCPCVGSSTARTTRIIEGLFVIQILCLIAAFFLLFASVALIYGVHTWSRHLIWPWFICIVSSILSSLAYCIMWWAGDVRDYWMALTILEIIGVFINVYCVVVVYMFMQRLAAMTDEYEGKKPHVRYKINRNGYTRKDFDDYPNGYEPRTRTPEEIMKHSFPHYTTPMHQPYPPYSPSGMPQTPLPMPSSRTPVPPYPMDEEEKVVRYDREPKARFNEKDEDPVAHWVKDQQRIERADANSEPVMPSRPETRGGQFPLQHSRSVPSLYDGTLVSHKSCRHGKHRSSSRRRSRGRHEKYSSESDSQFESTTDRRKRRKSRSRYSESEFTEATDRWDRGEKPRRSKRSHSDHHNRDRDDRRRRKDRDDDDHRHRKRRHEKDVYERDGRSSARERRHDRRNGDVSALERPRNGDTSRLERPDKETSFDSVPPGESVHPLSGGISIPQHIVIPPSMGERGPDGNPLPQKFQINSEITINYDGKNVTSTPQSDQNEPYRRRYPAVVHSNV